MKYTKDQMLAISKKMCQNTLMETLEIEFIEVGDDFLVARMPVTPRVHQPDGVLHGGASVALAESVGSAGAYFFFKFGRNCYPRYRNSGQSYQKCP